MNQKLPPHNNDEANKINVEEEDELLDLSEIKDLLNREIEDKNIARSLYEALDPSSISAPAINRYNFQNENLIDNEQTDTVNSIQITLENQNLFFQVLDQSFATINENILQSAFMLPRIEEAVEKIPNRHQNSNLLVLQKLYELKSIDTSVSDISYTTIPGYNERKEKISGTDEKLFNVLREFKLNKDQLFYIVDQFKKSFNQIERIRQNLLLPVIGENISNDVHLNIISKNENTFVPKFHSILYGVASQKIEQEYGTTFDKLHDLFIIFTRERYRIDIATNAIQELNRSVIKNVMEELNILNCDVESLDLFYIGYNALKDSILKFSSLDDGDFTQYAHTNIQRAFGDVRKAMDALNTSSATSFITHDEMHVADEEETESAEKSQKKTLHLRLPSILQVNPTTSGEDLLAGNVKRIKRKTESRKGNYKDQPLAPINYETVVSEEDMTSVITSKMDFRFERRFSYFSKQVGDRAEEIVFRYLKANLPADQGLTLRWVSKEGETPGWDIEYVDGQNTIRGVEVKGTTGSIFPDIELTDNEWQAAVRMKDRYSIFLVTDCLSKKPKIQELRNPFAQREQGVLEVSPIIWRVLKINDTQSSTRE